MTGPVTAEDLREVIPGACFLPDYAVAEAANALNARLATRTPEPPARGEDVALFDAARKVVSTTFTMLSGGELYAGADANALRELRRALAALTPPAAKGETA